ncbi:restriction endonuclease subunit S [Streptomyces sp. SM1]|uniref:restriction endonuclease subunit S n=1 Tax=Streptomyces sp. SM1 TaxID=402229 RepID=UPI000CD562F3|nr:restriction endonuclease subunit S [Streptomyces sp. SM1]
MNSYRIKDVARINRQTLPEDTDPDFRFRYVDISAVDSLGNVAIPNDEIVFSEAPSRARRLAPAGSAVVSTVRTYLRAIGTVPATPDPLVFSTGFAVLEAGPEVDSRFLTYHCQSRPFIDDVVARSTGVSYPAINPGEIGNLRINLPSPEEQRRIADFLDIETSRIDMLAMKRDEQISTLSERELAVIGHALSGGATRIDGQPTGWPWLPFIPASWKIGPIYAYFSTELGKMLNPDRATGQSQRPYLRNANVHWYEINTSDMATMHFEVDEAQRYSLRCGDLLVCEGGAGVAEAAVWDGRITECYFQKSLHRVRQAGSAPVEWLMYWLRFAKSCGVFSADGNIATIPHLTGEQLRQYRIPVPNDGQVIVANASRAIRDMSMMRNQLTQAQKLVAERRQALITAALTGQFDVSTASGRNVTVGVSA